MGIDFRWSNAYSLTLRFGLSSRGQVKTVGGWGDGYGTCRVVRDGAGSCVAGSLRRGAGAVKPEA
jgi:hypothetical protein